MRPKKALTPASFIIFLLHKKCVIVFFFFFFSVSTRKWLVKSTTSNPEDECGRGRAEETSWGCYQMFQHRYNKTECNDNIVSWEVSLIGDLSLKKKSQLLLSTASSWWSTTFYTTQRTRGIGNGTSIWGFRTFQFGCLQCSSLSAQ